MKNLSSFLAWKYLTYKHKDANISFMIKICFLGILIGTFALMLSLIITNGFEKTIHEKMQGINAQIIINSPGNRLDYENIAQTLQKDFSHDIKAMSGNSIKQAILDHNNMHTILFLKGVDPEKESQVTNIASKIVSSKKNLADLLADDQIIIGYKMARDHNLSVGQTITILLPEAGNKKKILLKKKHVTISGIFNIGLEEYDNNFAFMSLEQLNTSFDEQGVDYLTIKLREPERLMTSITHAGLSFFTARFWKDLIVKIKHACMLLITRQTDEELVIKKLQHRLPHLVVCSWKDQYPALVSSLKLEKVFAFFILALITLVASMNMISMLFMHIQNKQRDIAIFKTMGMNDQMIRSIFLRMGIWITFTGSILGLGLAALAGYFIEKYPVITLPDVYYVSYLPARMDFEIFFIVFAATMLLGFFATWLPARGCKNINIPSILKHQ